MHENEEALFDALQHLKFNKHEIVIFWTTDQQTELDFDFKDKPYRFVDLETGQAIRLNPTEIKDQYLDKIKSFRDKLKLKCLQYQIDLVEVDVSKGYHSILQSYLLKRKRMM